MVKHKLRQQAYEINMFRNWWKKKLYNNNMHKKNLREIKMDFADWH